MNDAERAAEQPRHQDAKVEAGGFNRRNLFKVSTFLAGGGLIGQATVPAQASAQQPAPSPATAAGKARPPTRGTFLTKARERLYPTCRVCPVCDGVACSGDAGGIAGSGTGMSFQNNFTALQHVKLSCGQRARRHEGRSVHHDFRPQDLFSRGGRAHGSGGHQVWQRDDAAGMVRRHRGRMRGCGHPGLGRRQSHLPDEDVKSNLAVVERYPGEGALQQQADSQRDHPEVAAR